MAKRVHTELPLEMSRENRKKINVIYIMMYQTATDKVSLFYGVFTMVCSITKLNAKE